MKTYEHRFIVRAPLSEVAAFHRRSASMAAITPPPIIPRIHHAPPMLSEDDEMKFTLWLGPLPLRWRARFEDVDEYGFVDRQISGPFQTWVHRHSFRALDAHSSEVRDTITYEPKRPLFWRLIGLGMAWSLPLLFAYRGWKTRRMLES